MKHETEPMEVTQNKTWQEQFEEKLTEALTEQKEPYAVIYYQQALKEPFPGPVFEQFKNSFVYPYFEDEHRETAEKLMQEWTHERLKS